jgi:hypothetical protein
MTLPKSDREVMEALTRGAKLEIRRLALCLLDINGMLQFQHKSGAEFLTPLPLPHFNDITAVIEPETEK